MPTYTYLAKKNLNETVEGILVADNEGNAVDKLIEMGLSPVRVAPLVGSSAPIPGAKPAGAASTFMSGRSLNVRDLNVFTSQLKSLVRARVDLLKVLSILYGQADKEKLKALIFDLHATIKNGATFSEALTKHPKFFPSIYVNLVKTGEASGRLDEVLDELDQFLAKDEEFRMHLRTAMAYPTLMIIVGVVVVFVLLSYVIPKLSAIFMDFDYKLPMPTQIMLAISGFFKVYWWLVLGAIAGVGGIFARMNSTPAGRAKLDWLKLKVPVVAGLALKQSLSRFCRTLALLIRSGLPAFQALGVSIPTMENAVFVREMEVVKKDVLEGSSMASSMKKVSFLPAFFIQMVSVGEEGGKLDGVLTEVANIYTQEIDAKLKVVTSLMEPLIILFLGVVLGGIVMAMLLPIFQINLLIK
jgi:general secretion pathway protein F